MTIGFTRISILWCTDQDKYTNVITATQALCTTLQIFTDAINNVITMKNRSNQYIPYIADMQHISVIHKDNEDSFLTNLKVNLSA